ncbi:hypothetical protein MmiAt1_02480 [Methanimicrococcus sp. At1]|uniref:DUF2110 domain-containing protein n=1 Tax=Methanimicrococcus hacksteinii TaxID=3028293 RepID=A0ABU3VMT4_9EURY|nr:DUF2110 family protein [Methanimicrococcus sp. At1]MDV0444712.1 hypothetical protein [Methanimicrococcus sp. At1]
MKTELLQPVYVSEENAVRSLKAYVDSEFKELDADFNISVFNRHFSVEINGEDESVCASMLYEEFGRFLTGKDIEPGSETVYKAFIKTIEPDKLIISVGFDLEILSESLVTLGIGSAGQIAARFGMIPYLPVKIQVLPDKTAVFAKEQIDQWWTWKKTSTDRIFVNGATRSQVKAALQKKGHGRDVYGVEKLGLTECVIVCKEKTDGPGIVSSIGKILPSQMGVLLGMKK